MNNVKIIDHDATATETENLSDGDTFNTDADREYVVLHSANVGLEALVGETSAGVRTQFDGPVTSYTQDNYFGDYTNDRWSAFGGIHVHEFPGEQEWGWVVGRISGTSEDPRAKLLEVLTLMLGDDDYAEGDAAGDNTSSSTFQNIVTSTPSLTGDYIVLAMGMLDMAAANKDAEVRLYNDDTATERGKALMRPRYDLASGREPWGTLAQFTGLSGAQDFRIQLRSIDNSTSFGLDQLLLMAIRTDLLRDVQYDEELALGQNATTTYSSRVSINPSGPGDYLVIGCAQVAIAHAGAGHVKARVTVNGVTVNEARITPPAVGYYQTIFYAGRHTINSQQTISLDWASGTAPRNANILNAAVVALNLTRPSVRIVDEVRITGNTRIV